MEKSIGELRMTQEADEYEYYTPSVEISTVFNKLKDLRMKNSLVERASKSYIKNPSTNKAEHLLPVILSLDPKILKLVAEYLKTATYNIRMAFHFLVENIGRVPEPEELPEELVDRFCSSIATGMAWIENLKKPIPKFQYNILNLFPKKPTDPSRICQAIISVLKSTEKPWPECQEYLSEHGYELSYSEILKIRSRKAELWLEDLFKEHLAEEKYGLLRSYSGALAVKYILLVETKLPWLEEMINKNWDSFEMAGMIYLLNEMDNYSVKPVELG